jgi:hypothetical protein
MEQIQDAPIAKRQPLQVFISRVSTLYGLEFKFADVLEEPKESIQESGLQIASDGYKRIRCKRPGTYGEL